LHIWHLTADAPRMPHRVSPGDRVTLTLGTWPIELGQRVWITVKIEEPGAPVRELQSEARWVENRGPNSYWQAQLGPFPRGTKVSYQTHGTSNQSLTTGPSSAFRVGPKLYLALLWHQHQPVYRDASSPSPRGSHLHPWVRLHATRDYYGMASLVAQHPGVQLTINLTPSLLWQLEDLARHGATDHPWELSLKPPSRLSPRERDLLLQTFFDADHRRQIAVHPRYAQLLARKKSGASLDDQEARDLQMWFNLAWFAHEFRQGEVRLVTGELASVRDLVAKGQRFDDRDFDRLHDETLKILQAVVPIHRTLQEEGQIEVSTSPFFHPILPLLIDTDRATLDRPGTSLPTRFAHPEDAEAQVRSAVDYYRELFRRRPRGMWPAEGAVSQLAIPFFAQHRLRWIATDRGVLKRSGRHGYQVDDPDVLCRPYRAAEGNHQISVFFRDTRLSDDIGFVLHQLPPAEAARLFLQRIKDRFVGRLRTTEDRVLSVVVDGENAWGAYPDDGRPFLHALYTALEDDPEIETTSFAGYIEGSPERSPPHPLREQQQVHDLYTGSWIDEAGSRPGVDLGTWIGEHEENTAWELLAQAREFLDQQRATPASAPEAFHALYAAEGSDWFWWFGDDQDSGRDSQFDELFRMHLRQVYRSLGADPPPRLDEPIVPRVYVWEYGTPGCMAPPGHAIAVRTQAPGSLSFRWDQGPTASVLVTAVGGVMSGITHYQASLGLPPPGARTLSATFDGDLPPSDERSTELLIAAPDALPPPLPGMYRKPLPRPRAVALLALSACNGAATKEPPKPTEQRPVASTTAPTEDAELARWIRERYTKFEHRVPMRDGTRLHTVVYVPKDTSATAPILLARTPYSVQPYGADAFPSSRRHLQRIAPSEHFLRAGYILAHQDVRGRMMSEGEFVDVRPHNPSKKGQEFDESSDAYDTIDWLVKNVPRNNGRVGMWGISYPGFYAAMGAIDAHPALRAVSPQAPVTDWFMGDDFHHNGALFLEDAFDFYSSFGKPRPAPTPKASWGFDYSREDRYAFFLELGPLSRVNELHFKNERAFWNDLMAHETLDDFWKARNPRPHYRNIKPATLVVGGWYDAEDLFGALETYRAIEAQSTGNKNTLVMGPWTHGGWARSDGDALGPLSFQTKTSLWYREHVEFPFFERYLRDKNRGKEPVPEAWIFGTGINEWYSYDRWPPRESQEARLWFHPGGKLAAAPPPPSTPGHDAYLSDPNRPVPYQNRVARERGSEFIIEDQRFASTRPDVLVYQTGPLDEDVTLAGPLRASLWASTTGTDADFIVKLIDVFPETYPAPDPNPRQLVMGGFQHLVRAEVFRGKFRNSFEHPEPFTPDEPVEIKFSLPDVHHTFRPGHRIQIQVQSSWFPLVDRNPQRFLDIRSAKTEDFRPATHRIFHTPDRPSFLAVTLLKGALPPP
jgi:putative CocE/NonD family hydrolase